MKKIIIIAFAAFAALVSCTKEQDSQEPGKKGTVTFMASIAQTKTHLGDKDGTSWHNYWTGGDVICVNGVNSEPIDAVYDGKTKAEFIVGNVASPYKAVYPASAVTSYQDGVANLVIPASQTYVEGSYDPASFVMIGSSSSEKITFAPKVSILSVTPTGNNTKKIHSITLAALGAEKYLAGEFVTNFTEFSPAQAAVNAVTITAGQNVALGKPWMIVIPAGDYSADGFTIVITDEDGGTMTRIAKPNKAYEACKMYSTEIAYVADELSISAEGITSSTAIICWSTSPAHAYTIKVYSDSACQTLVDSYAVPENASCWGEGTPRFCVSGLTGGTTYYVTVTDEKKNVTSAALPVTTAAFTIVQPSDTPADVNQVILAEDFSEFRWDCDMIGNGAGWFPTSEAQASFTTLGIGSFQAAATSNEKQISAQGTAVAASRLAHWAQGANPHMYVHPGYIKLVGQKKVTHIVTPALNNIPEGKLATIQVEVTASAYYSASGGTYATTDAVVAVQTGALNELVDETKTNTLDLATNIQNITLVEQNAWKTYTATLSGVVKGNRIAFGADASVTENAARMNISDIKITITALETPTLTASLKSVSSSTAAFTWTYGGEAADDVAKPYTAAIYSDAACSNLVASYAIPAGSNCWGGKQPAFVLSGLAPSTNYWFKVTDTEANVESDPVACTTSAFTVVDATTVSNAGVGDVILAEDFSEIGWGSDDTESAAGFYPSQKILFIPSGSYSSEDGSFSNSGTSRRLYGDNSVTSDKRLYHWGFFGNSAVYAQAALLRVCTSASKARTHIVSPALAGIPDGYEATVDVTVTARQYANNTNDIGVFVENSSDLSLVVAPDDKDNSDFSGKGGKYTGASLSNGYAFDIKTTTLETKTVRLYHITKENSLLFGSYENIDTKNRFYISDVKVTIVDMKVPGAIEQVVEISDFASFKAFLTACDGKTVQGNLNADITLTAEQNAEIDALYPVAQFDGVVNGNNHTIAGLTKPLFNDFRGTASNLTLDSTLNITDNQDEAGIFAKSASQASLTGCVSKGSITHASATEVSGDLIIGGMIGSISGSTLTACHNLANVTNTTTASGTACIGGLVGVANGANDLSGNSTDYNYNQGLVIEDSATEDVAVGGVCGYSTGAASNFNYCKSLAPDDPTDYDDIEIRNNTKNKVYVGGIIGKSAVTSSMDYTYNSSDIKFTELKITETGQVFGGGIIGGWSASGEQTINGCENKGWVYTKDSAGDLAAADSDALPKYWSCFAGIAGMGAGTSESLGSSWYTITGKTFTNCTNTGTVRIYAALRSCIAGVVAYTENNPDGCVSTASDIRPYLTGGIAKVGDNYHRNICGGVVGLCTASKVSNLKSTAKIVSQSSSPFAYTGGIIGYVPAGTIELENCKVSKHVQAAGSGDGRCALMCHVAQNAVTVTFTNCVVMSGTISYATGKKVTISDSNLSAQHCVGSGSNYTIVNDVLPTVADSID